MRNLQLEVKKQQMELEFRKLQNRIEQLEEEIRNTRIEQYRYQGEYRLINRLLEELVREGKVPPFNEGGGQLPPSELSK